MGRSKSFRRLILLVGASGNMLAQPVMGQSATTGDELIRVCGAAWVQTTGEIEAGPRAVQALCWGTWLSLGEADAFRVSVNFELEATIVELERADETTVLLIRPDVEGRPFIENMNATLADAAGLTPPGELDGLALDYGHFAFGGRIGIAPKQALPTAVEAQVGEETAESAGAVNETGTQGVPASSVEFEVGGHIARDAARLSAVEVQQER